MQFNILILLIKLYNKTNYLKRESNVKRLLSVTSNGSEMKSRPVPVMTLPVFLKRIYLTACTPAF